jgi:nitric oxide reductase NorE protein
MAVTEKRHLPGEQGTWVVILGELTVFAAFFSALVWTRGRDAAAFQASQAHLHQGRGLFNTVVLLTGSLCVATAVHRARAGRRESARALLLTGVACGLLFLLVKVSEYHDLLAGGFTPATNDFFTYYFVLTALHLLHLIIGMSILTALSFLVRKEELTARQIGYFEGGGCFWHMVDVIWIVLFPLLYLLR